LHSPELLSPTKRRRIQSWLDPADDAQMSVERAELTDTAPVSVIEDLDGAFEILRSVSPAAKTESSRIGYTQPHTIVALRERLVVEAKFSEKPTNWEDIKNLFAAPRTSPEPSLE